MLDGSAGRSRHRPALVFQGTSLRYAVVGAACVMAALVVAGLAAAQDEAAFTRARQRMVEQHLKARDITDARVL